jgi:hypothetical protein
MRRTRGALIALVVALCLTGAALAADRSYKWEGSALGVRIKVTATAKGEQVSGVAHIVTPGKKDTYHFSGTLEGNRLNVSHHSGHVFSGTLSPEGRVEGVLTTKTGQRIPISASSS